MGSSRTRRRPACFLGSGTLATGTRRLELVSAKALRNGAVATHYRRAR